MGDVLGTLIRFLLGLALIAAFGHALWLLVAWIFGLLSGRASEPELQAPSHCPQCGGRLKLIDQPCRLCGFASQPHRSTLETELVATERQLSRLTRMGMVKGEQSAELLEALRNERARLREQSSVDRLGSTIEPSESSETRPVPPEPKPRADEPRSEPSQPAALAKPAALEIEQFLDERAVAPPAQPAPTQPARQRVWDVLQALMEEKNIRWGELVSGLLIVGSGVGLVTSLWSTLSEKIPYFAASLFMLVTAAIHGAGLYTFRRWKLKSTSQGLLVISTLLVPLSFLAAIKLSEQPQQGQRAVSDPLYLMAVAVGLLVFGAITVSAGRILMRPRCWPLFVGQMGTSATQLWIARLAAPGLSTVQLTLLAAGPLLAYLVAVGGQLGIAVQGNRLTLRRVSQTFLLLGLAVFSLLMPLGLLVTKTGAIGTTLARLSPEFSLVAATILGAGLIVHRRVTADFLATTRTAGTSLALIGTSLMLLAVVLAWPQPDLLIAVGLVNFAALTTLAVTAGMPILHTGAVISFALASLVGFHLFQGNLSAGEAATGGELLAVILMGRSGIALTLLTAIAAGLATILQRTGHTVHAEGYRWSAASLGAVSLLIAFHAGFWPSGDWPSGDWPSGVDRWLATPVFGIYAIVLLAASPSMRHRGVTWVGSALLLVTLLHGLEWNAEFQEFLAKYGIKFEHPVVTAALLHAAITGLLSLFFNRSPSEPRSEPQQRSRWESLSVPLSSSALIASVFVVPVVIVGKYELLVDRSADAFWTAGIWLLIAFVLNSRMLFSAAQALATVAVGFAVTAVCQNRPWWSGSFVDPRHLQAQLGTLACWSLLWIGIRRSLRNVSQARHLMQTDRGTVDQFVLAACVLGVVGLATLGVLPGIRAELEANALRWTFGPAEVMPLAYAMGTWVVLGLVSLALIASLWDRFSKPALSGLVFAGVTIPLLVSARFEPDLASASAVRWSLAVYALIVASAIAGRNRLAAIATRVGCPISAARPPQISDSLRNLSLSIAALPILALTLYCGLLMANRQILAGPVDESFFARMGTAWLYAGPLWILTLALGAYALRDRKPMFALAGSFLTQMGVSLAYVLPKWQAGLQIGFPEFAELLQYNALAISLYSLLWLALDRWVGTVASTEKIQKLTFAMTLDFQLLLAMSTLVGLALWAVLGIVLSPGDLPDSIETLGSPLSYGALLLTSIACLWSTHDQWPRTVVHVGSIAASALIAFIAASTFSSNSAENWLSYHVLSGGWCAMAAVGAATVCATASSSRDSAADEQATDASGIQTLMLLRWTMLLVGLVVVLALRGEWQDAARPWWSAGVTGATAVIVAALAMSRRRQPYAYTATLLAMLATTFVWLRPWIGLGQPVVLQSWVNLAEANLITASLAGLIWLAVEIFWQRSGNVTFDPRSLSPPVHHAAAGLALVLGAGLTVLCVGNRAAASTLTDAATVISNPGGWLMLATLGVLLVASLWDRRAKHAIGGLYGLGLMTSAVALDSLALSPRNLLFGIGWTAAAYLLLTGLISRQRDRLSGLGESLRIPHAAADSGRTLRWLSAANLTLAAAVVLIEFWVVLTFDERSQRLWGATAAFLLVPGIAALSQGRQRGLFQFLTFIAGAVAAVDIGWALMDVVGETHFWLQRTIRLLVVLGSVTFVYAAGVTRYLPAGGDWFRNARRAATTLGGASLLSLLVVLIMEAAWFEPGKGAPVTEFQIAVVAAVLIGLVAALISLAVLPGRDPLQLTERGRMLYVYAAEAVFALMFLHIYLTKTELFRGFFRPYWPLIVMGIAYFGVGVGELFQRKRLRVLAEPLQNSGAFLPLLPAIGYWIYVNQFGQIGVNYSMVLFIIGLLYVMLSMWRKSFVYNVAAAVAGNGALWAMWQEHGRSILAHPQMWLIPPALSVLAAAQLNRKNLDQAQLTGIRYLCVMIIYVSSTGEMFINGVAENLVLPMVLAGLSVMGVFAGILMRIRAFLYLGSSFLLLSMVSMVWHAQQRFDHVWPWWMFGIVLGLAILCILGLFEKKRNEALRVLNELRQWER
jgi:hypothetical protein